MSKVTPKEYYICDYCGKKFERYHDIKYTDNSGINNICYDMCSDECLNSHLRRLKLMGNVYDNEVFESIEDWFKYMFWIDGKSYNCRSDNAKELFDKTSQMVKKMWNELVQKD